MSDNPYAPPGAHLERPFDTGGGSFDIGVCASEAWAATWANFPLWLGVGLVGVLVWSLAAVTVIGIVLVWPVLVWGGVFFVLRMVDGDARFADFFSGFSCYGHALITTGVLMLLLLLIQLVGQSVQVVGEQAGSTPVVVVGWVIYLGFLFAVLPRLNLAYFFAVDAGVGPIEALSRAWTSTEGHVLKVVGLVLLSIAVIIAGALALVVGVIPALVMAYLMWASAYRQLVGGGSLDGTRQRVEPRTAP